MTAVVGIFCSDGVVIGTDSSITMAVGQFRTIEQQTEKLTVIDSKVIIAGTGNVGHGQRFRNVVEKEWRKSQFGARSGGTNAVNICLGISREASIDFQQTFSKPGVYGALMAAPMGRKPVLCEFDLDGLQPTLYNDQMWFCSMGSTQPITDPFLALMREVFWPMGQPTVQEATLAVTWTLDHAIAVNPGGVNGPVRIAVLENHENTFQARLLSDNDLTEHRSWIEDAKSQLSNRLRDAPAAPRVPVPPK